MRQSVLSAGPRLIAAWEVEDKLEGCCSEDQFYFHHQWGQTLTLGPWRVVTSSSLRGMSSSTPSPGTTQALYNWCDLLQMTQEAQCAHLNKEKKKTKSNIYKEICIRQNSPTRSLTAHKAWTHTGACKLNLNKGQVQTNAHFSAYSKFLRLMGINGDKMWSVVAVWSWSCFEQRRETSSSTASLKRYTAKTGDGGKQRHVTGVRAVSRPPSCWRRGRRVLRFPPRPLVRAPLSSPLKSQKRTEFRDDALSGM